MNRSDHLFRRMARSDMSDELFFPADLGVWKQDRLRLRRGDRGDTKTRICGVRFRAADMTGEDLVPERQTQTDVVNLVKTTRRLRETGEFRDVVLDRDMRWRSSGRREGPRVKFGLKTGVEEDTKAARVCHKRIVRAVHRSGLVVAAPRRFDTAGGMDGLEDWAGQVKLRRRRRPWWLLLLPLLGLLFLKRDEISEQFLGMGIDTSSWIVLIDKSSSMSPYFGTVRAEAKRVLARMQGGDAEFHVDFIAYDQNAASALGGMQKVDAQTTAGLTDFLERLQAGGGTNLRAGIEMAAAEIAAHGKPTTLLILTDAQDKSIAAMLEEKDAVLARFKDVEIVGHALTPRLFGSKDPAKPQDPHEQNLSALASAFNGRFGPHDP